MKYSQIWCSKKNPTNSNVFTVKVAHWCLNVSAGIKLDLLQILMVYLYCYFSLPICKFFMENGQIDWCIHWTLHTHIPQKPNCIHTLIITVSLTRELVHLQQLEEFLHSNAWLVDHGTNSHAVHSVNLCDILLSRVQNGLSPRRTGHWMFPMLSPTHFVISFSVE